MRNAVRGALATAMTLALCGAASAQNSYYSYGQPQPSFPAFGGQGVIAPAATSTYQAPTTAQPTTSGSTLYPPATSYAPTTTATGTYAPQQVGTTYATTPSATTTAPSATSTYTAPTTSYPTATTTAPVYTTPSYGTAATTQPTYQPSQPTYQPAPTATLPSYGTPNTTYGTPTPLPGTGYGAATLPTPTYGTTPSAPATPAQPEVADTDAWTYNLARFYPAVQACLRRSTVKNPVIANVQERDNKTMMLIGEGGSSNYSTCSTGLTGTQVKANSDVRTLPPAFFAPLGSTFTVSPDRPFQPIVDTDQKVIGWMVRTQPANPAYGQFGQAPGFDGQFIPPMMVNTSVGKS